MSIDTLERSQCDNREYAKEEEMTRLGIERDHGICSLEMIKDGLDFDRNARISDFLLLETRKPSSSG